MKVVIVSSFFPLKKKESKHSFVYDEAIRLIERGTDIYAVRGGIGANHITVDGIKVYNYFESNLSNLFHVIPFIPKHLTTLPFLGYFISPRTLLHIYRYGASVSHIVKSNNIDLIHAHWAYPEGFVGLLAKRECKIPLIVTIHGSDILTCSEVNYGARLSRRLDSIIHKTLKASDFIISASTATYKTALKLGVRKDRLYLIPNGVDLKRFCPKKSNKIKEKYGLNEKFVIFALRSHEPQYGLEYLIKSIPLVLKKIDNAFFVIGGSGSLQKYHEALTVNLGVEKHVFFTGLIPPEKVPDYYNMVDVVVVPSLQEAFGLTITEAMACGKPVIGTNVGGIPDQVVDGYNGFLIKPKDPNAIAERILYLYDHPELAKRMGKRGREIAEKKFDINKRINKIIKIYKEII